MRIFLLVLIAFSFSCKENNNQKFSLKGETTEIENGDYIYMKDGSTNETIDSAYVKNNTFYFETNLSESPLAVVLINKDFSQRKAIWLEDSPMILSGMNMPLIEAKVSGSQTQLSSEELNKTLSNLRGDDWYYALHDFIEKNPNNLVGASYLESLMKLYKKDTLTKLYDTLSPEVQNSKYGKNILNFISVFEDPQIGKPFIDIELKDTNGNLISLSNSLGKVTFLEFWASWCTPCRKENPNLLKTYQKFKPKGFEIFAVSLDKDKNKWVKAIQDDKLEWKHVSDLKGMEESIASLKYGIYEIPFNFIIDENGIIVYKDLYGDELNEKLSELLN